MNDDPTIGGRRKHTWTLLTGLMSVVVVWMTTVEVPSRLSHIASTRSEIYAAWSRHDGAVDHRNEVARLRGERIRLEERLASMAGSGLVGAGPSAILDFIEDGTRNAGLGLLEMRPVEDERSHAPTRLPISLRLLGTFRGVLAFLKAVETSSSALPVRSVNVRGTAEASAAVEAEIVIDVIIVQPPPPRTVTAGSRSP